MKTTHLITVRGKQHQWSFNVEIDPKHLAELREDGLEIYEMWGQVPMWVVTIGMMRPWLFIQDCFNFRNPFRA